MNGRMGGFVDGWVDELMGAWIYTNTLNGWMDG